MYKYLIVFSCITPEGKNFNGNYIHECVDINEDELNKLTEDIIPKKFKKQYPAYENFDYQIIILNIIRIKNEDDKVSNKSYKSMSVKEFREAGYLQEVNRRLLHILGVALSVEIDDKTGEEKFGNIWDERDNEEGILYSDEVIKTDDAKKKKDNIKEQLSIRSRVRKNKCGSIIQKIDE